MLWIMPVTDAPNNTLYTNDFKPTLNQGATLHHVLLPSVGWLNCEPIITAKHTEILRPHQCTFTNTCVHQELHHSQQEDVLFFCGDPSLW